MAKIEDGASGAILAGVDAASGALRVSARPPDALGHYRFAASTGSLSALAAGSEFFQFRWSDAQSSALIQFLRVRVHQLAAFTAAQEVQLEGFIATGFTAAGTGGSQILATGTGLKKRSTMPVSRAGDLRVATTAALGSGTRLLSPQSFVSHYGYSAGAGTLVLDWSSDLSASVTESPFLIQQNEGLVLRFGTAMGAGGVLRASVEIAWAELGQGSF